MAFCVFLEQSMHALIFKKHTEAHVLTYYKYVTIACFDLANCDGEISGLGITNWMVCLCKLCLSDINYMPCCYSLEY